MKRTLYILYFLLHAVVSGKDGDFSLPMNKKDGESFVIRQVQKAGYELNDRDVIGRKYAFSSTHPIIIVMVSAKQLRAEKAWIENNAYSVAEKNSLFPQKLQI